MARVAVSEIGQNKRKLVDEFDLRKSGRYERSSLNTPETQVYKRRWLMLFLWALSNVMQGIMSVALSSSVVFLSKYYRVSETWIEWTSTVWYLTNIIFTIPSAWVLKIYGLKSILLLCASASTVGSVLLLFSVGRQGFPLAFVGIAIASVGSAFTNSVPPRLANVWFGPAEVSTANCVGILANSVGTGLGFLIPSFLLVSKEGTNGVKKGLEALNWSIMVLNVAILLATIFWYEEKPPIAPSKSVLLQEEKNQLKDYGNLFEDTRVLFRNTGFLCTVLSCAINQGVGTAFTTILDVIILAYFPEGQKDVGALGMMLNIISVPALILSGRILDKTKKFQEIVLWTMILNGASALAFLLFLYYHCMTGIYLAIIAIGIFNGAITGLAIEMVVELTFPISEGSSAGWLAIITGIGTVVLNNYCGSYVNSIGVIGCLSIFVILLFVGAALAWCVPKKYERQKANGEENTKDPAAEAKKCQINRF